MAPGSTPTTPDTLTCGLPHGTRPSGGGDDSRKTSVKPLRGCFFLKDDFPGRWVKDVTNIYIYIFCAGCKWWIITIIWLVRWVVFVWWFADKFTWVFVTIVSHMSTWHLVRESTLDVTMSTLFFSIFHLTFAVSDGLDERNPAPIIIHIVNILQFTSICRVIVFHILWTGEWCRTSTEWYPRLQKLCNRTSQTWIDSSHFAGLDWNWSPIRGTPSRRGNNETRGLKEFWLRNAYHQVQPPPSNSHNWRLIGIPW